MKIIKLDTYYDGGTVSVETDIGQICIDNRIHSRTKNRLYRGYPLNDNSNLIDQDDKLITKFDEMLIQTINDKHTLFQLFNNKIYLYLKAINKIHLVNRSDLLNGK